MVGTTGAVALVGAGTTLGYGTIGAGADMEDIMAGAGTTLGDTIVGAGAVAGATVMVTDGADITTIGTHLTTTMAMGTMDITDLAITIETTHIIIRAEAITTEIQLPPMEVPL